MKKILNKKFLIFNLFLILSMAFSAIVCFAQSKSFVNENSSATIANETTETSTTKEEEFLNLTYIPTSTSNIVKSGWSGSGSSVDGGTTITVTGSTSSATVTWGSNTQTYTPDSGYELTKFYVYAGSSDSGTLMQTIEFLETSSTTTFTPEDIITDYSSTNKNIFIKAETTCIDYTLSLYYQADENSTTYSSKPLSYNVSALTTIPNNADNDFNKNIKNFGYWILRKDAISSNAYNGYTIAIDETNSKIKVSKSGVEVTFTYEGTIDKGYKITSVTGYGEITQDSSNPLIAAKISRTYDLTIKSGLKGWNEVDTSLVKEETKQTLVGARSSYDSIDDNTPYETKIQIKDNLNYAYPFTSNVEYAFYKQEDIENLSAESDSLVKPTISNKYYYVFNYGYEVCGWQVYITYTNDETTKYYGLQHNTEWCLTGAYTSSEKIPYIQISKLNQNVSLSSTDLADLSYFAELVDEQFAGSNVTTNNIQLTIVPDWLAATVQLKAKKYTANSEDVSINIGYNVSYDLTLNNGFNYNVGKPAGQEICNYKAGSGIIVNSGIYNYINVTGYKYNSDSDVYSLDVEAEYLDNIYKVQLDGVSGYSLVDCGYKAVVVQTDDEKNTTYEYYSYSDSTWQGETKELTYAENMYDYTYSKFGFTAYKSGLIEDYIQNYFKNFKTTYLKGIDGDDEDDFEIFKTVFDCSYDGSKITSNSNSYIYLANNQAFKLPIFARAGYDLIAYINNYYEGDSTNQYAYLTDDEYNIEPYTTHLKNYTIKSKEEGATAVVWNYSDGYQNKNKDDPYCQLNAEFYRSYYLLDIQTLLEGETSASNHGYVIVTIDDMAGANEYDGTYLVYYYNGGMKVYSFTGKTANGLDLSKQITNSSFVSSNGDTIYLKLYSNCNLTLTAVDQSKDSSAALNDDRFLSLVGYKYNEKTEIKQEGKLDISFSDYEGTVTAAEISAAGLASTSTIAISVYFTQIEYNFTMTMSDFVNNAVNPHGYFTVGSGSSQYQYNTLSNIAIGDSYEYKYYAPAGYELQTNAFTIYQKNLNKDGNPEESQTLQENATDADGKYIQYYNLDFNSLWLRDNYYLNFDLKYSTSAVNLQAYINTQVIEFTFGVKVYDSTYESNYGIIYEKNDGFMSIFALTYNTGSNTTESIDKLLIDIDETEGALYVYNYNGTNYALLNSSMYKVNTTGLSDILKESYPFLLTDLPTQTFTLNSSILQTMTGVKSGTIIPYNQRKLYIMLEVRELYTIEISVDDSDYPDPDGERSTTVTNGTNNAVTISGKTTATMYTYNGAENVISSLYDTNCYQGVEYYLDDSKHEVNTFTTSKNHTLEIKYIVKPLAANVTYYVDNVQVADVSSYLQNISLLAYESDGDPANPAELYVRNIVKYSCEILNTDYTITSITINEHIYNSDTYPHGYEITAADYASAGVNIVVKLEKLPANEVRVKFALLDNTTAVTNEPYYGTITIYENDVEKESELNTDNFQIASIVETRSLKFGFTLNEGYEYAGSYYISKTNSTITSGLVNGKIEITDSFTEEEGGIYYIYITKKAVVATLTTENHNSNTDYINYSISSANGTVDSDSTTANIVHTMSTYVHAIITFTANEAKREVLNYFYYTTADGSIVYLTSDGTETGEPLLEFTLTSDVLETLKDADGNYLTLNFQVASTAKYKVTYSIKQGQDYIAEDSFKVYLNYDASADTNAECISGNFYLANTTINFFLATIETGKYDIIINSDSYEILNGNYYNLTSDINFDIYVRPKQYSVSVKENIYTNIVDLENKTPTPVTENQVNGLNVVGSEYNKKATLTLNYKTTECVLYEITISKQIMFYVNENKLYTNTTYANEVDFVYSIDSGVVTIYDVDYEIINNTITITQELIVKIDNGVIYYHNGTDYVTTNSSSVYTLALVGNNLVINYTITSDVSLTLNYAELKTISPQS